MIRHRYEAAGAPPPRTQDQDALLRGRSSFAPTASRMPARSACLKKIHFKSQAVHYRDEAAAFPSILPLPY
jgi:hypothetical protein